MEENKHVLHMLNIHRELNYLMNKKFKDISLGKHDVTVLKVVNENEGVNQNAICSILNEDKITVSKAVKRLSTDGYIEKIKSIEDKRNSLIFITDKGREIREKLMEIFDHVNEVLLSDLDEDERQSFEKTLAKVYNSVKEESKRLDYDE